MARTRKTKAPTVKEVAPKNGIKLSEIVAVRPALEKLSNKEMSADKAFEFATFVRKILIIIQEFENFRNELFQKYGEKQEDGSMLIKKENEEAFQTAVREALDNVVVIEPFEVAKLEPAVPPADFINMLPLFK